MGLLGKGLCVLLSDLASFVVIICVYIMSLVCLSMQGVCSRERESFQWPVQALSFLSHKT